MTEATIEKPSRSNRVWQEVKGIAAVLLVILGIHSCVAKPFYIPSESMMPTLMVGDSLLVTKYPYGYSWVSPSFHILPHFQGRLFGRMPQLGDIVILTPQGQTNDLIKRVVGLPGDTVAMRNGRFILNGRPVNAVRAADRIIPVDQNSPCTERQFYGRLENGPNGPQCRLPIVRETLPNGVSYDTIDDIEGSQTDNFGPVTVPAGHVFLMGDNRDHSADSRLPAWEQGLDGPLPWENIGGRAEVITVSLAKGAQILNPMNWGSIRSGRAGTSLRAHPTPTAPASPVSPAP